MLADFVRDTLAEPFDPGRMNCGLWSADAVRHCCRCRSRADETRASPGSSHRAQPPQAETGHRSGTTAAIGAGGTPTDVEPVSTPATTLGGSEPRPPANPANHFKQVLKGYKLSPEAFSTAYGHAQAGRRDEFVAYLDARQMPDRSPRTSSIRPSLLLTRLPREHRADTMSGHWLRRLQ